jgi:uroporphyrinogen decarboxylase
MSEGMTHRERFAAALQGREVDRPPISMWRHFYTQESDLESLAAAMLGFQRRFDWDWMKVNPRASYHVEDWGVKLRYEGDRPPTVTATPVKKPADWLRIEPLPPDRGVLGEQLRALELIAKGLKGKVSFLMTVFTPFSIASRLVSSEEAFLRHVREHPEKVRYVLDVVTETFIRFSKAAMERGADGLFYATTVWATADRMPLAEYERYARPSDLRLLAGLPRGGTHMLHVCKDHNFLPALKDYPVAIFNWDARGVANPSLADGKTLVGRKAVAGGLPHKQDLVAAKPSALASEVRGMRVAKGTRGWMLGSGCTFPPEAPVRNLSAIRRAVEG